MPDATLAALVRDELNLAPDAPITRQVLQRLYGLSTGVYSGGEFAGIKDLTGLEHATELRHILTVEDEISDLGPLQGLPHLSSLTITGNSINDFSPLAGLPQLRNLFVPVRSMALMDNLLRHVDLTQLEDLKISGKNLIGDLRPFANLTQLRGFGFSGFQIRDITPLAGLTQLRGLILRHNEIRDITPLVGLTQLRDLVLMRNEIRDVTPLAGLTQLRWLDLGNNKITDVTPLTGLTQLTYLDLRHNQITDVTPIQHLIDSANTRVLLEGNPIDEQPEGKADLVVTVVKAADFGTADEKRFASPEQKFTLYVTVQNQGTEQSDRTKLIFYRSTDRNITTDDQQVGDPMDVVPLAPQRPVTLTLHPVAPRTAGTYYYGACIADNNCSTQTAKITVTRQPELRISSIKVGQKGAPPHAMKKRVTVAQGEPFDLLINILNEGKRPSDETKVRFYRSTDAQISTSDWEIRHAAIEIEKVEPGKSLENRRSRVWAPNAPGTYYYYACVDTERNPDNNCSAAVTVIVPGLWKGFISQVAHSADGYTYFVVDPPHIVNVPGRGLLDFDVNACSVTLHTPASGYFMFPLDTLKGQRTVENLQKVEKSIKFGYSILGVLPKSLVTEGGLLKKLKDGIVGTVLKVVSIIGDVIDIGIEIVNPEDPTAPPTLTVTPSDGAWKTFRNVFIDELLDLENYEYEPFLPPMLFVIREHLSSIDITVKQVYNIYDDEPDKGELTYTYTQTWNLKESTTAAPSARPMSFADYAPFQQLPSEVQAYLLQFLETPDFWKNVMTTEAQQVPEKTSLLPNYPNPFNPETWIPYQLATPVDVTLTIYNIQGHVVRDLDLGHQRAGMYHSRNRAAYWDGRNAQGEPVASGIYFYTLTAGDFTATRKLLIRK